MHEVESEYSLLFVPTAARRFKIETKPKIRTVADGPRGNGSFGGASRYGLKAT